MHNYLRIPALGSADPAGVSAGIIGPGRFDLPGRDRADAATVSWQVAVATPRPCSRRVSSSIYCVWRLPAEEEAAFPVRRGTAGVRCPDDGTTGAAPCWAHLRVAGQMVAAGPSRRLHAGSQRCDGFATGDRQTPGTTRRHHGDGRLGLPVGTRVYLRVGQVVADSRHRRDPTGRARPDSGRVRRRAARRGVG